MNTECHKSRLAMVDSLLDPGDLQGTAEDFGCDDGIYSEACAAAGGIVTANDNDSSMVGVTLERLKPYGEQHRVWEGGVAALADITENSCDTLLALNVLAYLDAEQYQSFYELAAEILKVGGVLICTHSNEAF
jgi:2-polyprenyl-3-methyl-5-hydroxy-6-metoxy-1,4-benzoquinol methylase